MRYVKPPENKFIICLIPSRSSCITEATTKLV
jgi:hypothetical protein